VAPWPRGRRPLTLAAARAIIQSREPNERLRRGAVPAVQGYHSIGKPTSAFRLSLPQALEDSAATALWEHGTDGFQSLPAGDGRSVLLAYFSNGVSLEALARGLGALPGVVVEPAEVAATDWVARFREGFRPFASAGFRIVPAWAPGAPDGRSLVVDPGQAFGTGTHESTRLCLAALERLAAARPLGRVLDVGTGTGILAIAAARLGAGRVTAVDLDPACMESARRHAALNRTSLALVRGDGGRPFVMRRFDVVVANLTCATLVERRAELASLLDTSGRLVLAGFLSDDVPSLQAAYAELGPFEVSTDGDWAAAAVETSAGLVARGGRR